MERRMDLYLPKGKRSKIGSAGLKGKIWLFVLIIMMIEAGAG